MNTLGKRLKEARLSFQPKRLTQKEVAVRAGISQTTVADIERGRNDGSKYIAELARAVNCSLEWLASNTGEMRDRKLGGENVSDEMQMLELLKSMSPEDRKTWMRVGRSFVESGENENKKPEEYQLSESKTEIL
jgi:transcriptional regulator with XRE-family HTH domain